MVLVAKDIMETSILTVDEEADAYSCARAMVERRTGYAVVTRGLSATISGIVGEWDFLEKIVAPGVDPHGVRVKDLSSPAKHFCSPETPTDEVVTMMSTLGVRRIIVRSGDRVVGIITARNVLGTFRQYVDKLTAQIAGYQSSATPLG